MKKSSRSGSISTGIPISSNTTTVTSINNSSKSSSGGGGGNGTNIHNNNDNSNGKGIEKKMSNNDQDVNSMFRRTEIIGRGKFGIVYKGYHIKTKHVYAIKVLNLDSDEDEVEDVQREVQFLSSLKQIPNITRYYGSYLKNTSLWIIMEYCAGGSLRSLLRPGKVDEKYIGVIMKEVLIALKYIHRENIIHRDIKAANILITNSGSIKLCDFGVAAQLNQATLRRQTMAGTPYWMAPEVIMEGVYYDTKVDIWSLGITAYEIATGNPPYCDVEAIRAMQLITKSKPPRLEGRDYSAPLKEFIALCLDEDPNERLEAEELLNCKFIKLHKNTPTSILKELVTRYLLFRDKHKNDNQSVSHADEIKHGDVDMNNNNKKKKNNIDKGDDIDGNKKHNDTNVCEDIDEASQSIDNISVRWDFDSLSSTDYIIENNINIEAISEETPDWQHEQVNYAYPEEDHYSYYPTSNNINNLNNNNNMVTNSNKYAYQGTTIGKYNLGTTYKNSTFDVPITYMNTTGNYPSKMVLGTGTQAVSNKKETIGTHNTTLGSSRKLEAKAPKQLLELFEDTEVIPEIDSTHEESRRISKNKSTPYLDTLNEDVDLQITNDGNNIGNKSVNNGSASTTTSFNINNPRNNLINSKSYFTQSAPQLPHLQTSFTIPSNESSTTLMTAPTSIEIEIPEELPVSALPTPIPVENSSYLQTKPRSSTVSISPLGYQQHITPSSQTPHQPQQPHGLTRRLTLGGINNSRANDNETSDRPKVVGKTIAEEISRSASFANVSNMSTSLSNRVIVNEIPKTHRRTPSPAKIAALTGVSPTKKPSVSPTGTKNVNNTGNITSPPNGISTVTNVANIPAMRPIPNINENKDVLLHPVNVHNIAYNHFNNSDTDSTPLPMTSNIEKETSRVNADFKRNNPNLKLQMPLPAPLNKHMLLDSNNIPSTENINQFGFNTSVTQNAPVSMTPINEKYMDFNNKLKRSQSVSNRKNSLTSDGMGLPQVPNTSHSVLNGLLSTNTVNNHVLPSFGNSTASNIDNYQGNNETSEVPENPTAVHVKTWNMTGLNENSILNQSNTIDSDGTTSSATVTTVNSKNNSISNTVVMAPPSSMLRMSLFQDLEQNSSFRRVDRKPEMLKELDRLLHLFEENLPAMENALKRQLVPVANMNNSISASTNKMSITKSSSAVNPELQLTAIPTTTEVIPNGMTSSIALTGDTAGRS